MCMLAISWAGLLCLLLAPAGHYEAGMKSYERRDYAAAVRELRAFLKDAPAGDSRAAQAQAALGLSLYFQGQFRDAVAELERADLTLPDTAYALGISYLRLSDAGGARRTFARLFEVPQDSPRASILTASLMMRSRLEHLAYAELERLRATGAEPPEMHYLLGEIAIFRSDQETAIREFRREIEINPTFSSAWYRLGDAYSRLSRWDEAASALKKALWLNPDFSSPYVLLGKVYAELNQDELAAGVLEKALSMDPNNASARYQLARVYRKLGRAGEAQKQLELFQRLKK